MVAIFGKELTRWHAVDYTTLLVAIVAILGAIQQGFAGNLTPEQVAAFSVIMTLLNQLSSILAAKYGTIQTSAVQ